MSMRTYTEEKRIRPDVLTGAVYLSCMVFMVFEMIIQRIIGDKGAFFLTAPMVLYLLFYCVYVLAVQKAVYVMVRLRARRSQFQNARTNMVRTLRIFAITGSVSGVLIILTSYLLSSRILGTERCLFLLIISGAAIIFLGVQGAIRGFLQGIGYTRPIMLSDLLIAVVSLFTGSIASGVMYSYGLKVNELLHVDEFSAVYGAAGALFGVLLGSVAGLVQSIVSYRVRKREIDEFVKTGAPRYLDNKNDVLLGVRPIIVLYASPALMVLLDIFFYCFVSKKMGLNESYMTSYGVFSGKVIPTIVFLILLCCLPYIRSWNRVMARIERDELEGARDRYRRLIRFSNMLFMPVSVFSFVCASSILVALFGKGSTFASNLLMSASLIIYFGCAAVFFAWLLNHMGKSVIIMLNIGLTWIVHIAAIFLLVVVLKLDVQGVVFSIAIAFFVFDALCYFLLKKMLRYNQEYIYTFLLPLGASALSGLAVFFLNGFLAGAIGEILTLILCVVIYWALYMVFMVVSKALRPYELQRIPLGSLFIGLSQSVTGQTGE